MTLQDLIDDLIALPASARTATTRVSNGKEDADIISLKYEGGEVCISIDGMNTSYEEGKQDGYREGYEAATND